MLTNNAYAPAVLPSVAVCCKVFTGVWLRVSSGRGIQRQMMKQMKQEGHFLQPALAAGLCLCPVRSAGAEQLGCSCTGALVAPQLCAHRLLRWVRMRDASLILEIEKEPFHLRDCCEQPSHMG